MYIAIYVLSVTEFGQLFRRQHRKCLHIPSNRNVFEPCMLSMARTANVMEQQLIFDSGFVCNMGDPKQMQELVFSANEYIYIERERENNNERTWARYATSHLC